MKFPVHKDQSRSRRKNDGMFLRPTIQLSLEKRFCQAKAREESIKQGGNKVERKTTEGDRGDAREGETKRRKDEEKGKYGDG